MKRTTCIVDTASIAFQLLAISTLAMKEAAASSWIDVNNGLFGGNVHALVNDPSQPGVIFAGSETGIYKSYDRAQTWQNVSDGLSISNRKVQAVTIDPFDASVIYLGVADGIFRSTDAGLTWDASSAGLPSLFFTTALVADPSTPGRLYVAGASRVAGSSLLYGSVDGGSNWTRLPSPDIPPTPTGIVVDRADSATLYLTTGGRGIFKSMDFGMSWANVLANLTVFAFIDDPNDPNVLFVGATSGAWKTVDAGETWSQLAIAPDAIAISSLAIDPQNSNFVFAAAAGNRYGLYRTTDGGATWALAAAGLPNVTVQALAVNPANSSTAYAATLGAGLFQTSDAGDHWLEMDYGIRGLPIQTFAVGTTQDGSVTYVGTPFQGIYKTADEGACWQAANAGLASPNVRGIATSRNTPGVAYAATSDAGVFKTATSGEEWDPINNGLPVLDVRNLAVDPTNDSVVYAGTWGSAVYKTTDGGQSWFPVRNGLLSFVLVMSMAMDDSNPETLYASMFPAYVFKTTDGGESWAHADMGIPPGGSAGPVSALAVDPLQPGVAYAGNYFGVYKTVNGGANWVHASGGNIAFVQTILVDPVTPGLIRIGTIPSFSSPDVYGVFESRDAGSTWVSMNEGLVDRSVKALGAGNQPPFSVYVGSAGGGVFKLLK